MEFASFSGFSQNTGGGDLLGLGKAKATFSFITLPAPHPGSFFLLVAELCLETL